MSQRGVKRHAIVYSAYIMNSPLFFYPFEKDVLPAIPDDAVCAAIECDYDPVFDEITDLKVFNSFKPQASKWRGRDPAPMEANYYDVVFLNVPKQKIATKALIAKSLSALKEGGVLICMAANDAGGKTLEKTVKAFGVTTQSLSKAKARIVVAHKENSDIAEIAEAIEAGAPDGMAFDEDVYITRPGIFGWNKIDRGSYLLFQNIDKDLKGSLKGAGADFGCGYGYLSRGILSTHEKIEKFYAIDADFHALNCSRENLSDFDVEYLWEDLTKFSLSNLNFIVMNPPFHDGKKADNDIGARFIENASKSLKKNGSLYMVANAHLPYEKILNAYFGHIDKVQEQDGFKIFKAIK